MKQEWQSADFYLTKAVMTSKKLPNGEVHSAWAKGVKVLGRLSHGPGKGKAVKVLRRL